MRLPFSNLMVLHIAMFLVVCLYFGLFFFVFSVVVLTFQISHCFEWYFSSVLITVVEIQFRKLKQH